MRTPKSATLATFLLFLLPTCVLGQIRLGVTLPRRAFVVGESIAATITLQSQSSVPLVLGAEHHNVQLLLEVTRGRRQPERRPVQRDLVLMPGATVRDIVEITSLYDFMGPGNYRVNIIMLHEGLRFSSASFVFDIVRGIEMRSLRHMLPGYSDVELVYSFRYSSRERREEAFLVIENSDGSSLYGTFSLGPLLRLYQPVIRVRADGTVATVHQSGRNRYTRSIFAVDRAGAEFIEQRHFRTDGTPIETER